jgi:hypothetical protein
VFVPRLLNWQRGVDLKAGLTDCGCAACARAGTGLGRFEVAYDSTVPAAVRAAAREHDSNALADVMRTVMAAADPGSELVRLREDARELAAEVDLAVPKWLGHWD